jgi:voltage-gated potassium channel
MRSVLSLPVDQKPSSGWRRRLYEVIFEADTPAGRAFDLVLIALILASVAAVVLESIAAVRARYGPVLLAAEWAFTLLFTLEYALRLLVVRRPGRYAASFFGLVDLVAVAPGYISLLVPGTQALLVVRLLRVLRVFRILKLTEYLREGRTLTEALWASRRKVGVFLVAVLTLVVMIGSLMYLIEGPENGFEDIPTSIYWAVVTMTTVGYGDISPRTPWGRTAAAAVMVLGYGIIAIPTGIVTAELSRAGRGSRGEPCPVCGLEGHDGDARHCKRCGARLPEGSQAGP